MNIHNIIDGFKAAMQEAGIPPPDTIEADGVLHRFPIAGHKAGNLDGRYILHTDGIRPAGYFEDYKSGIKAKWKADGPIKPLTQAERQEAEAARQQRQDQQNQRYEQAANATSRLVNIAKTEPGDHPYLLRKNVEPYDLYRLKLWPKRIQNASGQWESKPPQVFCIG